MAATIYLQRRSKFGQWVTVEKLKLGPNSGRIFNAPHLKGTSTYRVYMTTNQAGTDRPKFSTPTVLINGEPFSEWQTPGALKQAVDAAKS